MTMYATGLYQYALGLLSYQIETAAARDSAPLVVKPLLTVFQPSPALAARMAWYPDPSLVHVPVYIEAARHLHTLLLACESQELALSFVVGDVRKNAALAMMRSAYMLTAIPNEKQKSFLNEAVRAPPLCDECVMSVRRVCVWVGGCAAEVHPGLVREARGAVGP